MCGSPGGAPCPIAASSTISLPRPPGSSCAASASRTQSSRRIRCRLTKRPPRLRPMKMAEAFATMKPPPVPVVAVAATAQSMPQAFTAIGSIVAVHQVVVSPEVGGRVTKIFFEPGAALHAGDPLIQINDEPEQGDLLSYRAQARLAQINLGRASQLASRDYGPRANVDTYQSQLDQANAGIAKTQALIAQKLIRAPFGGVLGIRQIDLGQYVGPGTMLVSLTDLDTLY